MITLKQLRQSDPNLVILGNHSEIIQSILDFDYLSHKSHPSIIAIIAYKSGSAKYFWGRQEILIPLYSSIFDLPTNYTHLWFVNLLSGRRVFTTTESLLQSSYQWDGGAIFAENVPELFTLKLNQLNHQQTNSFLVGPASIGLLVPKIIKLGAIGGITPTQIKQSHLTQSGSIAILSASGGMTNELINIAIGAGHYLSFALSFGGDRFPLLTPKDAFLLAEQDPQTKTILYYGELGGTDEYQLIKLKQQGLLTKPVIMHIAGTVAKIFPNPPQFGHAKAKANTHKETALAKRQALSSAGFTVAQNFSQFIDLVNQL